MRTRMGLTSGLVCAALIGGLALAQERRQEKSTTRTEVRSEQRSRTTEVRRVSAVVGGTVQISGGTSVGEIADIVITDDGCIDYVVVMYNDRYVPIPWAVTTVRFDDRVILVDIDQDRFDAIPTFTRNEFHVLADVEFTKKISKSFESTRRTREKTETRRSYGDTERKGDRAKDKDKDGDVDRKSDRPAPKGKDGDAKKDEPRKDGAKKDDSKKEDSKKGDAKKDTDKKDRPKDKDSDKKDKDEDKDEDKPEKKG